MKLAVFRADATIAAGNGHISRCLTLADELAGLGWRCAFATVAETLSVSQALRDSEYETLILPPHIGEAASTLQTHWPDGIDLLIVDHYGSSAAFESACRPWAGEILVIDDLADRRHDCDWLLDQTYGRSSADYAGLVSDSCNMLVGSEYALLRPQFSQWRGQRSIKGAGGRVLIAIGTTDPGNATGRVLQALVECEHVHAVDIILGSAAPHLPEVKEIASTTPFETVIHTDVIDVAPLISACDIAIGGGGVSATERCVVGLPSITLVVADNQKNVANNIAATGAAIVLDFGDDTVAKQLAEVTTALLANPARRLAMSRAAAAICDGRGVHRVAMAISPERNVEGAAIRLRPAKTQDGDLMHDWQIHAETRRYFKNTKAPNYDEHMAWLTASLADNGRLLEIVLAADSPAGVLRLDRISGAKTERDEWEVSLYTAPDSHNRGIGKAMLRLARRLVRDGRFIAEVHADNAASIAVFRSSGYSLRGGRYIQCPAAS